MLLKLNNFHLWAVLLGDSLLIAFAYLSSYLIRFEGIVLPPHLQAFYTTVFWIVPLYIATFAFFKLYKGMWRYTSIIDSLNLFKAVVLSSAVTIIIVLLLHRFNGFSRSVFIINGLLIFLLVGGFRISIRFVLARQPGLNFTRPKRDQDKKLLIVGAGSAGDKLIRELKENRGLNYHPVGLVDDNPIKQNKTLHGVPVLGPLEKLQHIVNKYKVEEIAIAVPSASIKQMRRIIDACKQTKATYKTLPGIGDIIQGKVTLEELRPVRYEDLLNRSAIHLDNDRICGYLTDKRVLVTGGAGSIGSELCRQIAAFSPQSLIVLERNESGLYELALDLKSAFPELMVIPALAAVQHQERISQIFSRHQPEVVFHTAAYKHVPMMENHPWEAVFNNVEGSRVILAHCHQFNVKQCVLVSTDKAVRPTNVMGATKRLAELLLQSYAAFSPTRYMAVRFGNVLGSVGSVLPLFRKQIAAGGPLTVTDPNMTRYFMTIPEACSLILQSGALGSGGEIFVLKMGTPVRIDDMARDLISLSGYRPGEDIEIRYTGLRPGEKLYEELITQGEDIRRTEHEDIMVLAADRKVDTPTLETHIENLISLSKTGDGEKIKAKLHEIIPEYQPWKAEEAQSVASWDAPSNSMKNNLQEGNTRPLFHMPAFPQIAMQDRLLLQLLSLDTDADQLTIFEALPVPDWEKILQSALKHNVVSLLYLQLKRSGAVERPPLKIRRRLRKIYLYFVQTCVRQQYWLGKILHLLNQNNIPAMLLDGPYLAENIYRNIAVKPISNLTLLVQSAKKKRPPDLQPQINRLAEKGGFSIRIISEIGYPAFECKLDPTDLWKRALYAAVAETFIKVPCPEDLVLHLCLKFVFRYQFQYAGLQTLCDLREIILRHDNEIDWKAVYQRSRELKASNIVGLTLVLTADLLRAPIPAATIQMFGSKNQFFMVRQFALKYIFDENYPHTSLPIHLLELWDSKSIHNKFKALAKLLFSSDFSRLQQHNAGRPVWKKFQSYSLQLPRAIATGVGTTAMLLANDQTVIEQIRRQQQNTLIWEWLYEKREFSKKISMTP